MKQKTNMMVAAVAMLVAGVAGAAEISSPAEMAPARAGLYIQVDQLAQLRKELANDPLAKLVRSQLPLARQPEAWQAVQAVMGMSGDEIIDRYFGQSIGLIGKESRGGGAMMLFSKVNEADAKLAVERLSLQTVGKVGEFDAYRTSDGSHMAYHEGWMAIAGAGSASDFGKGVIEAIDPAKSLATDATYKAWLGRLPEAKPQAVLYARDEAKDEAHVFGATRRDGTMAIHYAGQSADLDKVLVKRAEAGALEFGPIPANTVAAITLNLYDKSPDRRSTELLDRFVAPHTFNKDVLPKLAAPVIVFAAPVTVEGRTLPGFGIGIKLREREVAADLDKIMDGFTLFANLQTMAMKVDPIAVTTTKQGETSYKVADVGTPVSQKLNWPDIKPLARVTYGRIGDWYVLTTSDAVFAACVDSTPANFESLRLKAGEKPVLSAFVRAAETAAVMRGFSELVKTTAPAAASGQREKLLQALATAAGVLDYYQSWSVQFNQADAKAVTGSAYLVRRAVSGE